MFGILSTGYPTLVLSNTGLTIETVYIQASIYVIIYENMSATNSFEQK